MRATADARVSTPLRWEEVADCRPEVFSPRVVQERFAQIGDPWAGMDDEAGSLEALLARAAELGPAEKAPAGSDCLGSAGADACR